MILVDTSVWIDHFHSAEASLVAALEVGDVVVHPMVIGELALGTLRRRAETLGLLADLAKVTVASDREVLRFVEQRSLSGHGLSLVDAHLLAALLLMPGVLLWVRDRRLRGAAEQLGISVVTE